MNFHSSFHLAEIFILAKKMSEKIPSRYLSKFKNGFYDALTGRFVASSKEIPGKTFDCDFQEESHFDAAEWMNIPCSLPLAQQPLPEELRPLFNTLLAKLLAEPTKDELQIVKAK